MLASLPFLFRTNSFRPTGSVARAGPYGIHLSAAYGPVFSAVLAGPNGGSFPGPLITGSNPVRLQSILQAQFAHLLRLGCSFPNQRRELPYQ
jgi:hypothetical protein